MTVVKSEKALYVKAEAPVTCHIWFVCKGHLIYKREGISLPNEETMHVVLQPNPNRELKTSDPVTARSVRLGPDSQRNHLSPNQNHHRAMSLILPRRTVPEIYTDGSGGASTSNSARHSEASSEEQEGTSRTHISHASHLSTLTSLEESGDYQLYNQLDQAMAEARNSRREAFEESMRRGKAEQEAVDAILKARSSERLYAEELKQRKELEAALLKERLEHEQAKTEATNLRREAFQESMRREKAEQEAVGATHRVKASEKVYDEELKRRKELEAALLTERLEREKIQNQRDKDRDELQHARDQLSQLERRITESARLFINYKKESDALQIESENAHQLAEDLRRKQAKFSSTNLSKFFSEIPFLEIEEANK